MLKVGDRVKVKKISDFLKDCEYTVDNLCDIIIVGDGDVFLPYRAYVNIDKSAVYTVEEIDDDSYYLSDIHLYLPELALIPIPIVVDDSIIAESVYRLTTFDYKFKTIKYLEPFLDDADFISAKIFIEKLRKGVAKQLDEMTQEKWEFPLSYSELKDINDKRAEAIVKLINKYINKEELPDHIRCMVSYWAVKYIDIFADEDYELLPKLIEKIKPKFNAYYADLIKEHIIDFVRGLHR